MGLSRAGAETDGEPPALPPLLLGVDVGGTFTDAAILAGDRLFTAKVPTTPADQSAGVIRAITQVAARADIRESDVSRFAHGMTVGTNALLEERGARTALIATRGFTDLLEIARQNRPSLYHPCEGGPAPLVDPSMRVEVAERIGPSGVIDPLSGAELDRVVEEVTRLDPEAVAICLLFAFRDPEHERRLAAALRERLEGVHVSASHEVLPQFREYERCSTTVVDAYLSPLLGRYLRSLETACRDRGLPAPQVMRSSGGTAPVAEAARAGAWSVLSGPAGGAIGAAVLARVEGGGDALGLDMGGTSCDVCVIEGGRTHRTASREIGGRVIQLPMIDIHTVGAGGGSVAWADPGGALRVGPRSAGAEPGPACYGRGGIEPTVTDANLMLGYLAGDSSLAGGVALDSEAAEGAIARLGDRLGLDPLVTAEGVIRVADQEMVRALRVVTVERGVDPRRFSLLPFGGAGPMHAAAIADALGITRILCPSAGGVLSALGLVSAANRRDTARTVLLGGDDLTGERIAAEVAALADRASQGLDQPELEVGYDIRYRGQAFELEIPGPPEPDPDALAESFAAAHEERYGYRDTEAALELVTVRVAALERTPEPSLAAGPGPIVRSSREARFGASWCETEVLRGDPPAGTEAEGPRIFELAETTLVLAPGWRAEVAPSGTIVAQRSERR